MPLLLLKEIGKYLEKDYMKIHYNKELNNINLVIVSRDMQFNLRGDVVASGMLLQFTREKPWK